MGKASRREFIKKLLALPPLLGIGIKRRGANTFSFPIAQTPPSTPTAGKSRVVLVKNARVIDGRNRVNRTVISKMVNQAVMNLTGKSDPKSAWEMLFSPADIVGIKLSCLAGRPLSPKPELVSAIVSGLTLAGIPEENIILWERTSRELRRAGFTIRKSGKGVRCYGTDEEGVGYEDAPRFSGEVGSCFSRILTERITALINLPIVKDHDLAGVSIALKNMFGAIHNPNKYHDNNCDPYIADLNNHYVIRSKLKLVVADALIIQYHGGPSYKPPWAWRYGGIIVSKDPVAVDALGADLIEKKRKKEGLPSLADEGRPPKHIKTAASYGLGEARLDRLEIIRG